MTLTKKDIQMISDLLDKKLDEKLKVGFQEQDAKFDQKLDKKLKSNFQANNKILLDYMDKTFATKKDLKRLEKKISFLPKKDEFYQKMDKWMQAASTKDIEKTSHKSSHNRTDKRLGKIKSHLNIVSAY